MPEPAIDPETSGSTTTPPPVDPPPPPPAAAAPPPAEGEPSKVLGHGGGEMTEEAISERVTRARRSTLREVYGTDDPAAIKKIKDEQDSLKTRSSADSEELAKLRRGQALRERSRMTREQRGTHDLASRDETITQLQGQIKTMEDDAAVAKQESDIVGIMAGHINPDEMDRARYRLGQHVKELRKKDSAKHKAFGHKQIERWMENFAKTNPSAALKKGDPKDPATPPPLKETRKAPITTGGGSKRSSAPTPAPTDGPTMWKGKDVRPGRPNSMNDQELQEFKVVKGLAQPKRR